MQRTTIIAALALVLAAVAGGGVWAATTHSSTLTPGANESVSSVWVELQNETETQIEVYTGGKYDERLKDTDTASEFENTSTTGGWAVEGSGSSAILRVDSWSNFVDGFEDGSLSEWGGDGSGFSTASSGAIDGQYSLKFSGASTWQFKHINVSAKQHDSASMTFVSDGSGKEGVHLAMSNSGTRGPNLLIDGGTVYAQKSASNNIDTGISISQGTVYRIHIKTVNYSAETYDIRVETASGDLVGTYQDAPFRDSITETNQIQTIGQDPFRVDSITTGSTSATYTAPTKTATNASSMSVSVPTVSSASVTVEAQGRSDGGSWVTIDSQTVSSSTTVSTDVSQLDYTEWRWVVTASPSSSSAVAEVGYSGVTNATYVPPTLVANTTTTPVDSPSVESVDIPSAYADADSYTVEVTGQQPSSVGYSTTQTGGAVAADSGAQQSDGISLALIGTVLGLVIAGVILHGRR